MGGDSADLIQYLYQCNFPEALRRLGISGEPLTLGESLKIKQRQRRKAQRIQRERDLLHTLGTLIRTTRKCMDNMTPEEFHKYGDIMHELPAWEHYHQILSAGTREERNEVLIGLRGMTTIRRNHLFKPGFNYRLWLFNINRNEKGVSIKGAGNEGKKRIRN